MHDYDVTLKSLLLVPAARAMRLVTRADVTKWLDIELPKVQNLRLDLLGETADGGLVQVELQSVNDPGMPLRMAEYALGVFRLLHRFPRQIVLYVDEAAANIETELRAPSVLFGTNCSIRRHPGEIDGHRTTGFAGAPASSPGRCQVRALNPNRSGQEIATPECQTVPRSPAGHDSAA